MRMQRSWRRGWMVVGALSVASLVGGCSSNEVTSTGSTSTTAAKGRTATSSTTTTTEPGQWVPDDLPPCPAPSPDSAGYTTVGTWLPTTMPDGLVLESASSSVATSNLDAPVPEGSRTFLLAEVADDGRVGQVLRVTRNGAGDEQPGFGAAPDEPTLDRVRGVPGEVYRRINRGDSYGEIVAVWDEGGASWQAGGGAPSVEAGVEAFAAALEPLELSDDGVTDPTGRFELLGATPWATSARSASVTLSTPDATVFDLPVVTVRVDPTVEGLEGLPSLATGPGATYELIDGRPASFDQFGAITRTDDGSVATAEISRESAGSLTGRDLVPMLQSLRAVDHDDPELVGLPLVDRAAIHNGLDWATIRTDASVGYCRDW